jgi:hypothetical protein
MTDQPTIETGGQTGSESYSTALNAGYRFNSKLSLDMGISQGLRFLGNESSISTNSMGSLASDTRDWSTMEWLNYQFTSQWGAGIGVGGGYTAVKNSTDMSYEQVMGRLTWKPGAKLTMTLSGGGDCRRFEGSDEPILINPVFSVAAAYQLFEQTSLSLTGARTVNQSYFLNQVTEITTITAGLSQRLFGKVTLGVSGTYHLTTYQASLGRYSFGREDSGTSVSVRLSCSFLKRAAASVFASQNQNTSNTGGYGFTSSQAGFDVGYRF